MDDPTQTDLETALAAVDPGEQTQAEAQAADADPVREEVSDTSTTDEPPQQHQIGFWNELANFGCPHCGFKTLGGSAAVDQHILERHNTNWLEGV